MTGLRNAQSMIDIAHRCPDTTRTLERNAPDRPATGRVGCAEVNPRRFATSAAANGASESSIANQTGHRSMEVLRRYVRHGNVFTDNAVTTIGL